MANYHIIGGDGKDYGPITAEDIRLWITEGRLNTQTQARGETETAWRTLGLFPEFAEALRGAPPTIAPPGGTPGDANWEAAVLARTPELKLGECLGAGFSFLAANAGFLAGAVLLAWVTNLLFVLGSQYVPLLGPLALVAFHGVIMGGFYFACLRRLRGEAVSPVEVFWGFKNAFGPLLLTGLVAGLLTEIGACCLVLPMIYLLVAWFFALLLVADKKMFFWAAMELSRKVVTRAWFEVFALLLVAFLPLVIITIINSIQSGLFILGLYDEANQSLQQLAQLIQTRSDDLQRISMKATLIAQGVLLVNLFYATGVVLRAYENLFGPKKP
jgi:hypothetical protein